MLLQVADRTRVIIAKVLVNEVRCALYALPLDPLDVQEIKGSNLRFNVHWFLIHASITNHGSILSSFVLVYSRDDPCGHPSPLIPYRTIVIGKCLIGPYRHLRETRRPVGRHHCHIQGVTSSINQHVSNAGFIVARIEGPPAPRKVYLHPGTEIHRSIRRWNSYIWQVTKHITSRNVERPTKCHCQVREIAAYANPCRTHICGSTMQVQPHQDAAQ